MSLIIGPRQVGKTVLLRQLALFLVEKKRVKTENIYHFNLDIIKDQEALASQTDFIRFIEQRSQKERIYVFIDEVQKISNAGVFLKGVYDSELNVKLVLTGSSTLEIKSKIQESLTGRKRVFYLLPFSFLEILRYRESYVMELLVKKKKLTSQDKQRAMEIFQEYCLYGGYPQAVLADDILEKRLFLQEIFTSYIEKDVIGFLRIENESNFSKLVRLLAAQVGQLANIAELSTLVNTDRYTIDRYLNSLVQTFVSYRLKPYFSNARQEIVKMDKVFFIDNGLRNSSLDDFSEPFGDREDRGSLMENAIQKELLVRAYEKNFQLRFWRTKQKAEVDFVIEKGQKLIPIEVKTNLAKDNISSSLAGFIDRYQPDLALIINMSYQGKRKIGETEICFILPYELDDYL
jgi:predicted AAA+ superfamily ATPase